jgi:DNA polymerase/3'-5' exonuclease PolX
VKLPDALNAAARMRMRIADALRVALGAAESVPSWQSHVLLAGSVRRGVLDVGDIDLMVVVPDAALPVATTAVASAGMRSEIDYSYKGGGDIVRLYHHDAKFDVRLTTPLVAGATWLWLTGCREFGRSLEAMATAKGWTFTADGVHDLQTKQLATRCDGELQLLQALTDGWWVAPHERVAAFELCTRKRFGAAVETRRP